MDEATEKAPKLIALQDLHFFSDVWTRASVSANLASVMAGLLGDQVEFHHTTLNTTPHPRRLMRMGYRSPHNVQLSGQCHDRTGIMVCGLRPKGSR